MAKISQASAKYIIHANIEIEGVVDRPDVVGAIFGQIEGLLGADLELRELQRSGRIGRIEVNVDSKNGKTAGTILIPSSLDKAETAIVGGALEIIERIGPCEAKIAVTRIEDERASKRQLVINRAKELLKNLTDSELPESKELSNEVSEGVKIADIKNYGRDKLAAGPDIDSSDEVIFVEGRADVLNLLRHGFRNVIAVNGTSAPDTIKQLSKKKTVTLFCDGDRGGDLIIKELMAICELDYITKAPDGKEVEELQMKEIHQALRSRRKADEWAGKTSRSTSRGRGRGKESGESEPEEKKGRSRRGGKKSAKSDAEERPQQQSSRRGPRITDEEKKRYKELYEEVKGSNSAYILDKKGEVLGKAEVTDLSAALPNLDGVSVVVIGGKVDKDSASALDKARVRSVVGEEGAKMRSTLITPEDLS